MKVKTLQLDTASIIKELQIKGVVPPNTSPYCPLGLAGLKPQNRFVLFVGAQGTGKTTSAKHVINALRLLDETLTLAQPRYAPELRGVSPLNNRIIFIDEIHTVHKKTQNDLLVLTDGNWHQPVIGATTELARLIPPLIDRALVILMDYIVMLQKFMREKLAQQYENIDEYFDTVIYYSLGATWGVFLSCLPTLEHPEKHQWQFKLENILDYTQLTSELSEMRRIFYGQPVYSFRDAILLYSLFVYLFETQPCYGIPTFIELFFETDSLNELLTLIYLTRLIIPTDGGLIPYYMWRILTLLAQLENGIDASAITQWLQIDNRTVRNMLATATIRGWAYRVGGRYFITEEGAQLLENYAPISEILKQLPTL